MKSQVLFSISIINFIVNLFAVIFLIYLIFEILNYLIKKVPPVSTSSKNIKYILEILNKEKRGKGLFVDLGCGTAKVLIAVKRKYPEMKVIGYEIWPTQFLLAKIRVFLSKTKTKIFYKDLYQADLKNADIVFFYLFPHLMVKLKEKLEKELKPDVLIICNTFLLPNWQPLYTITTNEKVSDSEKIFVYVTKKY